MIAFSQCMLGVGSEKTTSDLLLRREFVGTARMSSRVACCSCEKDSDEGSETQHWGYWCLELARLFANGRMVNGLMEVKRRPLTVPLSNDPLIKRWTARLTAPVIRRRKRRVGKHPKCDGIPRHYRTWITCSHRSHSGHVCTCPTIHIHKSHAHNEPKRSLVSSTPSTAWVHRQ